MGSNERFAGFCSLRRGGPWKINFSLGKVFGDPLSEGRGGSCGLWELVVWVR